LARDIVDWDLTSGAAFVGGVPHDAFDALREHGGIAWHDEPPVRGLMGDNPMLQFVDSPGFWVVTSYDLVGQVDRDQELFSSELEGTFILSPTEESLLMFRQMMLNMDHPHHTRLRRILQPRCTRRSSRTRPTSSTTRTATRRSSPIRIGSTCCAPRIPTSPSGSARTAASARTWRGWRPPRCCVTSSGTRPP
jgi:cytochrome P450